jgi:hypothetical protein
VQPGDAPGAVGGALFGRQLLAMMALMLLCLGGEAAGAVDCA